METVWWILIILCFAASFLDLVFPFVPGVLLIWIGVGIHQFLINSAALAWSTIAILAGLTVLLFATDSLANLYFVRRYGGTRKGMIAAAFGIFIGAFIFPPFGILVVPFVLVLLTETLHGKSRDDAFRVAFGTLIAFLSGAVAKAVIHIAMIVLFLLDIRG